MKISESWLRELADITLTSEQLVSKLTMAGLEVDGVEAHGHDIVIDIDLTPNRADCISMQGIARELKAIANSTLKPIVIEPIKATIKETFPVKLLAPEACAHYVGRVIKDINPQAATPDWMVQRLETCGLQSISPVVDVTNYVMLELGQPMHAFDLDKLQGGIELRWANSNESLRLIDAVENDNTQLAKRHLVIADKHAALAVAGIKGGELSKVTDATANIFLESAYFNPANVAVTSRKLGIHSDSAYRFARGVDPQRQVEAIERATALLLEITGGEVGPVIDVSDEKHLPKPATISFRPARASQLLGVDVEEKTAKIILENLGMQVKVGEVWQVTAPSYRFDMLLEEDLIEEIARVIGYDELPAVLPEKLSLVPVHAERQLTVDHLRDQLVSRAYQEVMTYSFIDEVSQKHFFPEKDEHTARLVNPVSSEMAEMRKTIWPSLVKSLQHNLNRQVESLRIFELGAAFTSGGEVSVLSGLVYGKVTPEQWRGEKANADFYTVKSDLVSLFALSKSAESFVFRQGGHVALHPGQTAEICRNEKKIGYFGSLHPALVQELELPGEVFLFELEVKELLQATVSQYKPLSKFPSIRRDLAFIVDEAVEYEAIVQTMKSVSDDLLTEIKLFDVYQGKGIQLGQKSMAFGLILQAFSRTLKEKEVAALLTQIVNAVQDEHGATLRN